jgi:hypothetical protein
MPVVRNAQAQVLVLTGSESDQVDFRVQGLVQIGPDPSFAECNGLACQGSQQAQEQKQSEKLVHRYDDPVFVIPLGSCCIDLSAKSTNS